MTAQNQFEPGEATKAHQRAALLAELRVKPVTTIDARDVLGIAHPAGRVFELRRQGLDIVTESVTTADLLGRPHRVARYRLRAGGVA